MVKLAGLSSEIVKALQQYTGDIEKALEEAKKEVAQKAVQTLKETSPKGPTGRYAKGWDTKDVNGKQVIYNKTDYQLTHLLEYGHAKVNGGRVDSKPHIRPVEEQSIKDYMEAVEKVVKG